MAAGHFPARDRQNEPLMRESGASQPKVSIVIPVYNGADFLREAIESALAQTYTNLEILVVNDGSTDGGNTERVALEYQARIRYFAKPNGGTATALNLGLQEMSGEWFSWLSHDDVYYPQKIQSQIEFLKDRGYPDCVVSCGHDLINERSEVFSRRPPSETFGNPVLRIMAADVHGCALLVSRRCFDVVGFFNPELRSTQDNDMWLRIALAGYPFYALRSNLVGSRQHPGQGSRTMASHPADRLDWYRGAISAVGSDFRAVNGRGIAAILLRDGYVGLFSRLVLAVASEAGPRVALSLFVRQAPELVQSCVRKLIRLSKRAVRASLRPFLTWARA